MPARRRLLFVAFLLVGFLTLGLYAQESPPAPSAARILLLPRRIVSGERATLAVLDVKGRLTPGVTVTFSNGDQVKTNATGRAFFVAPLDPGVIFGSIDGRPGRVPTTILAPAEAAASSLEVSSTPRFASLADRFEILGKGFCGDADANRVTTSSRPALVLASSPASLLVLPPADLDPGPASVSIACSSRKGSEFFITFVELALKADSSPLKRGEHRTLSIRVRGTTEKIALEARNLAPDIAVLSGGNPLQLQSSGGDQNVALFDVVGQKTGNFLISIRLVPSLGRPQ